MYVFVSNLSCQRYRYRILEQLETEDTCRFIKNLDDILRFSDDFLDRLKIHSGTSLALVTTVSSSRRTR
jgi:hypothetical protein